MTHNTETPFICDLMIAEGIMQDNILDLPLPKEKCNLRYIRRYDYTLRQNKIDFIKDINTVRDAFIFFQTADITDFPLDKKKSKDVSQENLDIKTRDSIFTGFVKDALIEKFGENNFKGGGMIVDESKITNNDEFHSDIFNVFNMINIFAHIKNDGLEKIPFLNVSFYMSIEFKQDIFIKDYQEEICQYLKISKKKLPISYMTEYNKKTYKAIILGISTLGKIDKKYRDNMRKFNHLMEDESNYDRNEPCARISFYHQNKSFYIPLKTIKLETGSNLITMKNDYDGDKYDFNLNSSMLNILSDYSDLRNIILKESKSYTLRTNKIEEFAMKKFDNMLNFQTIKSVIYPQNHYDMDRRLDKNKQIDLFVLCDPHSKNCAFYDSIKEIKSWNESNVEIKVHYIQAPLFMYEKEINENPAFHLELYKDISEQIKDNINLIKNKEKITNNVLWILWPKRIHENSKKKFVDEYCENDNDVNVALSHIKYNSAASYKTLKYRIPKIFLEYDLLSYIPIQNSLEGYKENDFENAKFNGFHIKMRNIAEGIITQSETLNQQLEFLHDKNINEVDVILSWDVTRNMKDFNKRDMACYCCHILPVKNNKIIQEYNNTAISMARLYDGGKEKRDKKEISEFYNIVTNKLNEYNIKINHKIIVRDGILYEDLDDVKDVFGTNSAIIQVKKSNIISYIDPNKYMDKYQDANKTNVIIQKDGKKRFPNRYIVYIEPSGYKQLGNNEFIFGASCKVAAYKTNNDRDNDPHCRSLHLASILHNETEMSLKDIMMTIGNTCASNTTTAEGLCMLPYAQKMADRIPYEFIKDGNMGSKLSYYVELSGNKNAKQHILEKFNEMLLIYGSNMFT